MHTRTTIVLAICAAISVAPASATECTVAALYALRVPKVTITSANNVPAAGGNPQYCDVRGSLATSGEGAGSGSAAFAVNLPSTWNGKFVFHGVGGLAGSLDSSANAVDRTLFLARGYATAITDTGHISVKHNDPVTDLSWQLLSPGKPNTTQITDYFYRAVHQVTLASKQMVKAYYNSAAISHSYLDGCSNGGKIAMMEATRYPDDYDGVIAGAPWLDPLGTSLWGVKNINALLTAYIPPATLATLDKEVTQQCDAADGTTDGLIQNPGKCAFDPQSMVPDTLTQQQADALKLILKPVTDEKGNLVYPGPSVSNLGLGLSRYAERNQPPTDPTGVRPWGDAGVPVNWNLASEIISNLGFYDPGYNLTRLVDSNGAVQSPTLQLLYGRLAGDIPDDPSKLSSFLKKGKKLLIYHGYDDPVIAAYRSIWLYEDLAAKNGGYDKLQEQVRLFMVPGMLHCSGGPGPNTFDTLTALENWVEKGIAPDSIVASHVTDDAVDRTMPLCKFPEQARYTQNGDVNDFSNWSCSANNRSLLEVGPNGTQSGLGATGGKQKRYRH